MKNNENQIQHSTKNDAPRRRPQDKDPINRLMSSLPFVIAIPLTLIFLEIVVHWAFFSEIDLKFFAYITLFGVSGGLVLALLCTLFNKKVNYFICLIFIGLCSLLCSIQVVYSAFFGNFFKLTDLKSTGNVADYMDNTVATVMANLHWILLLFLPVVLFAIFGRKVLIAEKMEWPLRGFCAVLAVCFFMLGNLYVNSDEEDYGDKFAYGDGFLVSDSIGRFGVFTTARLELQYAMFGHPADSQPEDTIVINNDTTAIKGSDIFGTKAPVTTDSPVTNSPDGPETTVGGEQTIDGTSEVSGDATTKPVDPPKPPVVDRSPQRVDIDLASLASKALSEGNKKVYNLLTFLNSRAGTKKNEYTGMFEGKNLIFITVEAWAPAAINEELTPTLYKMKNEGFVFNNAYCSIWYGSTATGEYAAMTGNFYYDDIDCLKMSGSTYQPYALGNMFKSQGYTCNAYHNWTYDYYGRNISHPNFGYNWYAIGNYWSRPGDFSKVWPTSDHELALNSLSFYTADEPFHYYYMTTSGHSLETFSGNSMAYKHKDLVTSVLGDDYKNELSLSYIASQYEVELMVKELYDKCEELGILEDTVFVMLPDHFPYKISENETENQKALAELYGLPEKDILKNYELYRTPIIIWSASMENPVQIDKVCSTIDVVPTILNLFGMEYDSRLLAGQDILDPETEGIAPLCFLNPTDAHNFITDYGFFNIKTKKFTLFEGYNITDQNLLNAYLDPLREYMYNMRILIPQILQTDLYRYIFQ